MEKVKHTKQRAVNHSLLQKYDRGKKPQENNKDMLARTGLTTGGGLTVMPPQIKTGGGMEMEIMQITPNIIGIQPMAGLHIILTCLPSHTQSVSYPGWNPGTRSTCAETLFT